jgi:hypothetical protein
MTPCEGVVFHALARRRCSRPGGTHQGEHAMKSIPWKTILITILVTAAIERIPQLRQLVKGA